MHTSYSQHIRDEGGWGGEEEVGGNYLHQNVVTLPEARLSRSNVLSKTIQWKLFNTQSVAPLSMAVNLISVKSSQPYR